MYRRSKEIFFSYCNIVIIFHLFQNMVNCFNKFIRGFTEGRVAFLEILRNVVYNKEGKKVNFTIAVHPPRQT